MGQVLCCCCSSKPEKELSTIQIKKIKKVINNFNKEDIDGFKKILYQMIENESKKTFQHLNE